MKKWQITSASWMICHDQSWYIMMIMINLQILSWIAQVGSKMFHFTCWFLVINHDQSSLPNTNWERLRSPCKSLHFFSIQSKNTFESLCIFHGPESCRDMVLVLYLMIYKKSHLRVYILSLKSILLAMGLNVAIPVSNSTTCLSVRPWQLHIYK